MPGLGTLSEFILGPIVSLQIVVHYPVLPEYPIPGRALTPGSLSKLRLQVPQASLPLYHIHSRNVWTVLYASPVLCTSSHEILFPGLGGGHIMVDCSSNTSVMCLANSLSMS